MSNIWNDDSDAPSEYELLEEATETEHIADSIDSTPHEVYDFSEIDDTMIEEIQNESAFNLEETEVSSVYNVRVRLEQARLYEMLINHNLFDGVEASEQAISNVQKEIKDYIITRLELLMGIRQPQQETINQITVEPTFNDVEIDFLKALSYKGTNGASSEGEYTQPETTITPVTIPKQQGLKSLAVPKPAAPAVAPVVKKAKKVAQKKTALRATPKNKVAPKKARSTAKRKVTVREMNKGQVNMTTAQAEDIAREEIAREKAAKKKRGGKDWGKMKPHEKAAEIKRVNDRNAKAKPANAMAMPDQNAINSHYQTQEAIRGGQGKGNFNVMLANAIANKKI